MNGETGHGARLRDLDGRRYGYLWHCEAGVERSRRREDHIGRVDSGRARKELPQRIAAYPRSPKREFAQRRDRGERALARVLHTSA